MLSKKFCFQIAIVVLIYTSLYVTGNQVYAQDKSTESNTDKPQLRVSLSCQVASAIIPASFNATGFPPNIHVGVVIQKSNITDTNSPLAFPFKGLHNDMTDSQGRINGEFNIDTRLGSYQNYFLQVFSDTNRDDLPDSSLKISSSAIDC
jgi:hypothetical protein